MAQVQLNRDIHTSSHHKNKLIVEHDPCTGACPHRRKLVEF